MAIPNDRSRRSLTARKKLLTDVLAGKKPLSSKLKEACASQSTFAKLDMPLLHIIRHSLNTLKKLADEYIEDGGWSSIDELRLQVVALDRVKKTKARPIARDDKESLAAERRARLRLMAGYSDLLAELAVLSATHANLVDVVRRHRAIFSIERLQIVT